MEYEPFSNILYMNVAVDLAKTNMRLMYIISGVVQYLPLEHWAENA